MTLYLVCFSPFFYLISIIIAIDNIEQTNTYESMAYYKQRIIRRVCRSRSFAELRINATLLVRHIENKT